MRTPIGRPWRPFWMHQGAEYLVGLVLIAAGLQSPTPTWPTLAGGLIIVNAALVDGPLGAYRAVSRSLHRRLDIGVLAVVGLLAALPVLDIDAVGRLTMAIAAGVLAFVWLGTDYTVRATRPRPVARSDAIGRSAGRMVARAVRAARNRQGP
jgi:hypothetical protein